MCQTLRRSNTILREPTLRALAIATAKSPRAAARPPTEPPDRPETPSANAGTSKFPRLRGPPNASPNFRSMHFPKRASLLGYPKLDPTNIVLLKY
jgi:hypothetical protein